MTSRIVLFGATGYTGELTARALVDRGAAPTLAGRSRDKLLSLAGELGGLEVAVADAERPDGSIRSLLDAGDVLISTVGPFLRYGVPAVQAAVDAGAHYLDSTGEPPFIRRVFEEFGPQTEGRCVLLTAFGYDYVPGNLAGGLVLAEAPEAARIDVGYFALGPASPDAVSSGTLASMAGVLAERGFAYRDGRLQDEPAGVRRRRFDVQGRDRQAISVGGSEHFGLPPVGDGLREVNVHLGWFGPASPVVQVAARATQLATKLPGAAELMRAATKPLTWRTGQGPGEEALREGRSYVVAEGRDRNGQVLAEAHLVGPHPYVVTAEALAWAASHLAEHGLHHTGARGPIQAFGLDALEQGCAAFGLQRLH